MELILSWLQQGLSGIIPFIIMIGLLVFVHELGHFLVAKYYRVRVEVFSLGFGKKILQHKRGDTTYCVSLIPLGGYVKMYGDDPTAEVPPSEREQAFLLKPVGQRIAIVLAGPLMNLFFAAFLFAAIAMVGDPVLSHQVGDIQEGTQAHEAGFRSGDRILAINDKPTSFWREISSQIQASANEELRFLVKREQEEREVEVLATPRLAENENILSTQAKVGRIEGLGVESLSSLVGVPDPSSRAALAGIKTFDMIVGINDEDVGYWRELEPALQKALETGGTEAPIQLRVKAYQIEQVEPERPITLDLAGLDLSQPLLPQLGLESTELYILRVRRDSPAERAGLLPGDKLVQVGEEPVTQWTEVVGAVSGFDPDSQESLAFGVLRKGEKITLNTVPEFTSLLNAQGQDDRRFTVGIVPAYINVTAPPALFRTRNPIKAASLGASESLVMTKMVVMGVIRLIQGEVSTKNIAGVITIGRFASQTFEIGLSAFLKMMAILSINLFIINLLPIPILDGGHLVFFGIEAIKGAPVSLRKMEIAQQVGLLILMGLLIFSLFNDITNWFSSAAW